LPAAFFGVKMSVTSEYVSTYVFQGSGGAAMAALHQAEFWENGRLSWQIFPFCPDRGGRQKRQSTKSGNARDVRSAMLFLDLINQKLCWAGFGSSEISSGHERKSLISLAFLGEVSYVHT
jgi:hypothetical protein